MKKAFRFGLLGALASSLFAVGTVALAQEKIVLRLADYIPRTHYFTRYATTYFIENVVKQSNGRVEIKHFPSEQLGKAKDMLSLAQSGVADITTVVPGFVSDRIPLSTLGELPGQYRNSCHGTVATGELMMNNGILVKEELDANNVVVVFTVATPTYTLFSTRDKLASPEDVKGLKIRTIGGVMTRTFEKLGAVGVQMATPEIYESLSRGTVNGLAYAYSPLVSGGFHKLVKSALTDVSLGGSNFMYVMGKQRWNALPPDIQKILASVGQDTMKHSCRLIDKDEQDAKDKARDAGVQHFDVSAAEKARLGRVVDEVAMEWVRDGAKRGKAADAVYKAYQAALAKPVEK